MRSTWLRLPRSGLTYNLGKILTRTILKPERASAPVDAVFAGAYTMSLDLADIVCNDIYCMDDHYEAPTLAVWRSLATNAETILDLGAHVGVFACASAAANPRAKIIAVEAFARNASMLMKNAAPFPNLKPIHAAIGVTSGRKMFHVSPITGGGYVEEESESALSTPGTRDQTGDSFVVEAVTLSEICESEGLQSVDLMKMDLEGLEHALLTSQEDFWMRWRPRHVIVEITMSKSQPRIKDEIFAAMAKRCYARRRVEGLYTVPWFQNEDLANWHFWLHV
jgi:FkbM family methyltransferase